VGELRTSELLAALSVALDLTEGQRDNPSDQQCVSDTAAWPPTHYNCVNVGGPLTTPFQGGSDYNSPDGISFGTNVFDNGTQMQLNIADLRCPN
jgi:hypothetical protein